MQDKKIPASLILLTHRKM